MAGGVNVPITSTWNNKGVKSAGSDLGRFDRQAKGFTSSITKSFLGMGAVLGGAFALGSITSSLKEMSATAMEDQASLTKLAVALRNMGLASEQTGVEEFIKNTMLATGVVDDELRPAFARLLRSTGEVAESQKALGIALDISAATGKNLDVVANGLGKAYDGNAASLGRLGLGLDKAILSSGDMDQITGILQQKFGGQAAAAAETYTGKMQRLSAAFDEARESIGYAFLDSIDGVSEALGGTNGMVDSIDSAGTSIANFVRGVGVGIQEMIDFGNAAEDLANNVIPGFTDRMGGWLRMSANLVPGLGMVITTGEHLVGVGEDNAQVMQAQSDASAALEWHYGNQADAGDAVAESMLRQKSAADQLKSALDRLYGNQQSRVEQRIALRRMRQEGPDKSGRRTSKVGKQVAGVDQFGMPTTVTEYTDKITNFTTADDARQFAVDYAQQAGQYASTFTSGFAQAKVLQDAQQYIAKALKGYVNRPGQFAAGLIGPDAVQSSDFTRGWERMYAPGGGNVVIQQMTVNTDKPAEAVEQARQWAKLARSAPGGRYGAGGAR